MKLVTPEKDLEFYPTTKKLAELMLNETISHFSEENIENHNLSILEPSAGMGMLAKEFYKISNNVDVCEIDTNLSKYLFENGYQVVGKDFLEFSPKNTYDVIVMNPPYSVAEKHILKAIEVLETNPNGGVLVTQASQNLMKVWDETKNLLNKLSTMDYTVKQLGQAYSNSEYRKTNIPVILLTIKIKGQNS